MTQLVSCLKESAASIRGIRSDVCLLLFYFRKLVNEFISMIAAIDSKIDLRVIEKLLETK